MFNFLKGWFGEKKTTLNMWVALNSKVYRRFHDIYIPTFNGTAQIDSLIISPYGIFIVETKNMKGWIFGDEHSTQWTQSIFGKKYRFQNPLRQTYRQKKALSAYLSVDEALINTVVYFNGDCEFKTVLPANVINHGLGRYIKRFSYVVLEQDKIDALVNVIEQHEKQCTTTNRQHVKALRSRHSSFIQCPKCGSSLVKRVAKKGANIGKEFLGCSNFPKCRFIKN